MTNLYFKSSVTGLPILAATVDGSPLLGLTTEQEVELFTTVYKQLGVEVTAEAPVKSKKAEPEQSVYPPLESGEADGVVDTIEPATANTRGVIGKMISLVEQGNSKSARTLTGDLFEAMSAERSP